MLVNIRNIISSRIVVIYMNIWYSYFNYQHYWNCYNANHLIFYLSNYFVSHVCYQRKDKHIKIFFSMLHHEESPEKLQYNVETPLISGQTPPFYLYHPSPPLPDNQQIFQIILVWLYSGLHCKRFHTIGNMCFLFSSYFKVLVQEMDIKVDKGFLLALMELLENEKLRGNEVIILHL